MPISGQTDLTTINIAKEQRVTFEPLLLIEIGPFSNGAYLHLSTENLDSTNGGVQYSGHDWVPRLMQSSLGALQSIESGIVQAPQVTIDIADADKYAWLTFEMPLGFKGVKMVVKFVFWDADTSTFSSDELIKFVGICNAPQDADDKKITILATNILNFAAVSLPTAPISKHCPWVFPADKASRIAAATDPTSVYYRCGYSPDVTDSDVAGGTAAARGNYQSGTTPFTDCGYTRDGDCVPRLGNSAAASTANDFSTPVQIEQDTSGRFTGNFGGVQWDPPADWRGRAYLSGSKDEGINNPNDAKYNDYAPMLQGTAFIEPIVANVTGDPNITVMEAIICIGEIGDPTWLPDPIPYVIVNDFIVPHVTQATDIMNWNWVNTGQRNGRPYRGGLYRGTGDPYGGLAVIAITVPRSIADSSSTPTIRVLTTGPKIRVYTAPTTYSMQRSANSAWNTLDLLRYCGVTDDIVDIQSFIDAAAVCDPSVSYVNLVGATVSHARYQLGLAIRERRSAAEILNNVIAGFKGMLTWSLTGKLQMFIKQTLCDQQSAPVDGSNDNTGYSSLHANGTSGTGYVAYHFTDADVLREGPTRDSPSTMHVMQNPISGTPNSVSVQIQDQDYFYTGDSIGIVDTEDVARAGQTVSGSIVAEGLVNLDQAKRVLQTGLAEAFRGNPRTGINFANDSGGTLVAEFETSFKGIKLRCGHIVKWTSAKWGVTGQMFRVISISPVGNCERMKIRMAWHSDDWYVDSYGQRPDPNQSSRKRQRLNRPPFGWLPALEAPVANDPVFDPTEKSFTIAPSYETAADGVSAVAKITIGGVAPINGFSQTLGAVYAPQATTSGSGGSLPAGTYWLSASAVDSNGLLTPPSKSVKVTTTGSTSTATLANIVWPSGTISWQLYAGTNPNRMTLQSTGSGTPSSLTITACKVADQPMPDVQFDHLAVKIKKVRHSGVFWGKITAVGTTTLQIFTDVPFTTNQWAARKISIIGQKDTNANLPILDFTVASNTGDTFTVTGVDFVALGVEVGDFLVMRTKPTTVTATTIGDSGFINSVQYYNPSYAVIDATNASPIVLEFASPHDYATGDVLYTYGISGNTSANYFGTITVVDRTHVSLDGTTGSGPYTGGGVAILIDYGLQTDKEKNKVLMIIAGTGRGQQRKIVSNTTTVLTVDSEWTITPDSTSVFIIVEEGWLYINDTPAMRTTLPGTEVQLTVPMDNFLGQTMWVQVFARSADERESVPSHSPGRELYMYGQLGTGASISPATISLDGFFLLTISSNAVNIELDNGRNQEVTLVHGDPQITVNNPTRTGGSPGFGEWLSLYVVQDGVGGCPGPAFGSDFGNDVLATSSIVDGTPNTTTAYGMTKRADGKWHLDTFMTGQAI